MKNNIETLQNLYLSARKKHSYNARKIYSNNHANNMKNKQIPKTERNHSNKDQINTSKQYNHTDRSMANKSKRYLLQKCKSTKNTIGQYKSKQKQQKHSLNHSYNINNTSKIHQKSTKHTNNSNPHTQRSHSRDYPIPCSQPQHHIEPNLSTLRLHYSQGLNCKIILLVNSTTQQQHYVQVDKMQDIYKYLKQKYPKVKYYKSMPSQLTVDYFLVQGNGVDGKFLNGQALYLKPCGGSQKKEKDDGYKRDSKRYYDCEKILKYLGSGGFSKVFMQIQADRQILCNEDNRQVIHHKKQKNKSS